jgi:hypothetical protein
VRVTTVGRSQEQAVTLAKQVAGAIAAHTIGDPARIQTLPQVAADAPDGGTVRIALAGGPAIPTASAPQAGSEKKDEKKKDEKAKKAKK